MVDVRSGSRFGGWVLAAVALGTMLALVSCGESSDDGASTTTATTGSIGAAAIQPTTSTVPATPSTTETAGSTGLTVDVYFSSGDGPDCGAVQPFPRTLSEEDDPHLSAFQELVAGPSGAEIEAGAGSFFSPRTSSVIKSAIVVDGLLIIDFTDLRPLMPNASTSCGSAALLAQLNTTAFQFTAIERTRFLIEGNCDEFGNWLQRECFDTDRSGQQLDVATAERASGSGCTPQTTDTLPTGRWFGFVNLAGIEAGAEGEGLAFDLACWFSGTAAEAAAKEDGAESPPPNDYYIRNESDRLRSLPIGAGTEVTWLSDLGDPQSAEVVPYADWLAKRAATGSDSPESQTGIWLTVDDVGQVVKIEEQYVP